MDHTALRKFTAGCIVAATAGLILAMFMWGLTNTYAANRDFIEYWAAGQQLVHGSDPYDSDAIFALEHKAGMKASDAQITFSPPFALCLILFLGFLSPKSGLILWLFLLIGSLLVSIWLLWMLNGRPDSAYHICAYMFAPAIACFMAGQLGIFLLLAVVLFLYFHQSHPYLAGVALLPCVWKPHLFLPFFIVLLLWSAYHKNYRSISTFLIFLAASMIVTLSLDRHVWFQYSKMMIKTAVLLHGFVPTLSVTIRFLVDPKAVWLQYIPEALACIWSIWYFWSRRQQFAWKKEGMLIFLVSALCTPYAWFTDEAMLLPAILAGVYAAVDARRSLAPIVFFAVVALIEVCSLGHIASTNYLWTVPAWFGWYVYATWPRAEEFQKYKAARAAE